MQTYKTLTPLSIAAFALPACALQSAPSVADAASSTNPVDEQYPGFVIDWTENTIDDRWYVSNHDLPDGHWASDFRASNVNAYPTGLNIKMSRERLSDGTWPWSGGEIQYRPRVSYGEYHTIMKAAPGAGLVTGFFTYIGAFYEQPHDEIDIEFVVKSPHEVQLNAFTDGTSMGMVPYPVDFDTTKNYALYSFTWRPDSISWYINGDLIYTVTSADFPIPQTPGILIGNLFKGREQSWVGRPDFDAGATAIFRCMSYRPLNDTTTKTCADQFKSRP